MFSYRVDVREVNDPSWRSLVRIRNKAALTLAGVQVSPQLTEIETGLQVFPSTVNGDNDAQYWLPSYFTQWYGRRSCCPTSAPPSSMQPAHWRIRARITTPISRPTLGRWQTCMRR